MTGWNATLVTRDGEEIEPSTEFKGQRETDRTQPSFASDVHAAKLRKSLAEAEPTGETFRCPECSNKFVHREGEADCLRSHARDRADRLQLLADDGDDVLSEVAA